MQTFPYYEPADAPSVGYSRGPRFGTEIVATMTGLEQRRILMPIPRQFLRISFGLRDGITAMVQAIEEFFVARKGKAEAFVLYDCDASYQHRAVYVGTTDGTTTVWDLPCRTTATSLSLYLDGVLQSSGFAIADTGANMRKRVTFSPAPAAGKHITLTFTGQRAFTVRFDSDDLTIRNEDGGLYTVAFDAVTVLGEG